MDKSKWEYKKLGEVATFINGDRGVNYPSQTDFVEVGIPFVNAGHLTNNKIDFSSMNYITREKFDKLGSGKIKKGDILFCLRGSLGKKAIADNLEEGAIASSLVIIRPSKLNTNFLSYYLESPSIKREILRSNNGSSQPNLSAKSVSQFVVAFPSIEEQQRIVAELDCLNEMIAVKQEQLKEFDKLAQSIFYDMFGDSDGYEKVKLGDVVEVVSGLVDPNTEPYCSQLHVSPANIVGGTNEIVNCVQAKSEGLISDKYPFKAGMILYSKIRPNLNKVAIARFDGICSADMYPLSVLPKANNVYITKLLSSKQFLDYAIKNSGRARMPKLNRETLFSYSFNLPPLTLQQQFAEKIQAIEAQKELVKQSIAETQHLLDSRMDYYFD